MRIDIPTELAVCVKALGGVVLDEILVRPNFSNADYWFSTANVVAELKCLTEDLSTKEEFNESIANLHASWVKRGLVPRPQGERPRINLRELPLKCSREFIEPIKKRLEASTIKKANRQIKETKQHFNASNAKGLLLLVNDGNYMLPPTMMLHLLSRILKDQHSSINSVIYFSVNEISSVPDIPMPALFWFDAIVPGRTPVAVEFSNALRTEWLRHHSTLVPGTISEIKGEGTPEYIDSIQFNKNRQ